MRAVRLLVALCVICAVGSSSAEQAAGIAPSGQKGYLHKVEKGDTLWDITAHYLGTPWTWPSIWKENDGINNPHLIYPGDLIWITEHGIRKVTPETCEASGYGFQVEMAWRTERAGLRIVEVPITFRERERGNSKMNPTIAAEAMWLVTKWGAGRLTGS